ncbi:hypothetical protein I552_9836 [Mycobacterium xenopi 3993]|nr:hypothetical protein I552_9836 [Mycobacterium xenopi 3993]
MIGPSFYWSGLSPPPRAAFRFRVALTPLGGRYLGLHFGDVPTAARPRHQTAGAAPNGMAHQRLPIPAVDGGPW